MAVNSPSLGPAPNFWLLAANFCWSASNLSLPTFAISDMPLWAEFNLYPRHLPCWIATQPPNWDSAAESWFWRIYSPFSYPRTSSSSSSHNLSLATISLLWMHRFQLDSLMPPRPTTEDIPFFQPWYRPTPVASFDVVWTHFISRSTCLWCSLANPSLLNSIQFPPRCAITPAAALQQSHLLPYFYPLEACGQANLLVPCSCSIRGFFFQQFASTWPTPPPYRTERECECSGAAETVPPISRYS